MANYDITNFTNSTNIIDITKASNDLSGGVLLNFFVVAIFLILLLSMKRYKFSDGLLVSGWVSFIISAFLSFAGLVNVAFTIGFAIITSLAVLWSWTKGD